VSSVARVLLIGRSQVKGASFPAALKKRYNLMFATNGKQAQDTARHLKPHVIVLDAVSMRTPGDRICRTLQENFLSTPIIHLHPGPKQSADSPADAVLYPPFSSSRKLINCIERLITLSEDEIITCGPFALNIPRRMLITPGQETQLTPKVALLVALFMSHPGETLDRKTIMEAVWNTDYLGDTRTLDVHIRWIRTAIEANPGKPVYLKTVRGIGYRFEVVDKQ
jgi:DNA-binding response OmpR family regulator